MLKAVIFDMDGVLIDSEPDHYKIEQKIFDKLGIKISCSEHERFCGTTSDYMWKTLKEKYNLKQSLKQLVQMDRTSYFKYLNDSAEKICAIDGVKELIQKIDENNIIMAVASSSPVPVIKTVIKILNFDKYFKALVSGDEVKSSKPAPDIFLAAAGKINVKPSECLVVEDSENGVKAAKRAEMKCIGYKNVNSGRQDLSGADTIINCFNDISFDDVKKIFLQNI